MKQEQQQLPKLSPPKLVKPTPAPLDNRPKSMYIVHQNVHRDHAPLKTSVSHSSLQAFNNYDDDDDNDDVFHRTNSSPNTQFGYKKGPKFSSSSTEADSSIAVPMNQKYSTWSNRSKSSTNLSVQEVERKNSSQSSVGSQYDSSTHNVIFGVSLRRLNTISWGVTQKRSTSSDSHVEDCHENSPPPSAGLTEKNFNTFPQKKVPTYIKEESKAHTFTKRSGGVKSKVLSSKLGDKSGPRYHSQSDLTTSGFTGAATWRRKSVSDDMIELYHHQPLTRRQSISDLLKLYRTKSQTDLSQIGDGPSSSQNHIFLQEENQIKSAPVSVVAPLKMSDLKIVNPMLKPKVQPYKPHTKDIVRLPGTRESVAKSISVPLMTNSKIKIPFASETKKELPVVLKIKKEATLVNEANKEIITDPSLEVSKDVTKYSRPIISAKPGQHFHKPASLPKAYFAPSTKSFDQTKLVQQSSKSKSPMEKKEETTKKFTRMITPSPYAPVQSSMASETIKATTKSHSSSSSSSSSEDERDNNQTVQLRNKLDKNAPFTKQPIATMINNWNKNVSKPVWPNKTNVNVTQPQDPSWENGSTDSIDGIPHDDKIPSFIVPQSPKQPKVEFKRNSFLNESAPSRTYVTKKKDGMKPARRNQYPIDDSEDLSPTEKVSSLTKPKKAPIVYETVVKTIKTANETVPQGSSFRSWSAKPNLNRCESSSSEPTVDDKTDDVKNTSKSPLVVSWKEKAKKIIGSSSSSSDSSDDEGKKTGFYEVNKTTSAGDKADKTDSVNINRFARVSSLSSSDEEEPVIVSKRVEVENEISKSPIKQRFTSDSSSEGYKSPIKSKIPQAVSKTPQLYETPKQKVPQTKISPVLVLKGESLPQVNNVRKETKKQNRYTSSSEEEKKRPNILFQNKSVRKQSSTSEDEIKITKVQPVKKNGRNSSKSSGTDSSQEKNSGAESFKDFDPYAIGRMIVRGARKSTSVVKKPENLTNINNASVPKNSPFSPLKENKSTGKVNHRINLSSSSSPSDEETLDQWKEQDGVYSASITMVDYSA